MNAKYDVAIIGAGPAGANAAFALCDAGLKAVVVDEFMTAGGQVWRAPVSVYTKAAPDGNLLRHRLDASGAALRFGRRLWMVEPGFVLHLVGENGHEKIEARRLIVASGTSERVIPFPGWTLPGVFGLAGATILLKSHGTLPGRRSVVAGRGPLLAAVANGILELGGKIAAIIDAKGTNDWLSALPALRHRPSDLRAGLKWWLKSKRHRVPWLSRSHIRRVDYIEEGLRVEVDGTAEVIDCDAVVVGDGLNPATEIVRVLGATMRFVEGLGGWVPSIDAFGRCSVPDLYACGDGSGVRGAAVACETGRLAGLAAACDAGVLDAGALAVMAKPIQARTRNIGRASAAMAELMSVQSVNWRDIPSETTICRCEDVSKSVLVQAIAQGASNIDQLKAWTRCGMGPCQGRMCGEAAAQILAQTTGVLRATIKPWTARPPFRPVPMGEILGEFNYSDIPIPAAAPI